MVNSFEVHAFAICQFFAGVAQSFAWYSHFRLKCVALASVKCTFTWKFGCKLKSET